MMMKRYLPIVATLLLAFTACKLDKDDDLSDSSRSWRDANVEWYDAQKELKDGKGNLFYQVVKPAWNPSSEVLIHWFNDRSLTAGNLTPLETSTVDVKYILRNYKGEPMDSSYLQTALGDSIYRTPVTGVISGWQIALQSMKVGDSVRLVVPYTEGYGTTATGSVKAYSTLQFDIKLVDIHAYEIK